MKKNNDTKKKKKKKKKRVKEQEVIDTTFPSTKWGRRKKTRAETTKTGESHAKSRELEITERTPPKRDFFAKGRKKKRFCVEKLT